MKTFHMLIPIKEQKIKKLFHMVLYPLSQKYKVIKKYCIFYFEKQSKMSKFSGGLRPPDPPPLIIPLKV